MAIQPLERNHYLYGKMMDVGEFEKEQTYFRRQLLLLNRLTLGSGVVCGLNVVSDPDVKGNVIVEAGVAIDAAGRLIIVPGPVSINPAQPTDDLGAPDGAVLTQGETLVSLSYAEFCADMVPALVSDCDTPSECAAATTRESFRILVRVAQGPAPDAPGCVFNFPYGSPAELEKALKDHMTGVCAEEPAETAITLARVQLSNTSIDALSDRKIIFTNLLLRQTIMCLGLS